MGADTKQQRPLTETSRAALIHAVRNLSERVVITDAEGRITFVNPAFERRTGYSAQEAFGRTPGSLVRSGHHDASFYGELWATIRSGRVFRGEFVNRARDGTLWREESVIAPIPAADGSIHAFVLTGRDVTELRSLRTELEVLAYADPLTGLANRRAFVENGERLIAAATTAGHAAWVLYIDIDRFKTINDTLGHSAGDALLVEVARRLQGAVGSDDVLARVGGDEFAVVLGDASPAVAEHVANRLAAALVDAFHAQGRVLYIRASIGIAGYPADAGGFEELVGRADTAMYQARHQGVSVARYDAAHDGNSVERIGVESELHEALAAGQFFLRYQPIVDLVTGRSDHVEALARWRHPVNGEVPPGGFLPLLEEVGLMMQFDRWVLREAARQMRAWAAVGMDLHVAVNLSAQSFGSPDLLGWVADALGAHGARADRLTLEITETAAMRDATETAARIEALAILGIGVALDDFGTGYSSLAYLKHFSIRTLKVDRSFVSGIGRSPKDERLVEAMIFLARSLDISVVAEGIETAGQQAWLCDAGCHYGQGYHHARPLLPDDLAGWARDRGPSGTDPAAHEAAK